MKVKITKVRAEASVHFALTGSVLAGTIEATAPNPYFVKLFAEYSGLAGPRMRLGHYFFCVCD